MTDRKRVLEVGVVIQRTKDGEIYMIEEVIYTLVAGHKCFILRGQHGRCITAEVELERLFETTLWEYEYKIL